MSDGLNRAQRTAVTTLSGPLLVLAGAGTGKTRVITYRIAELIRSGVTPNRILAVTFTNKAAREMKQRALGLLSKNRRRKKGQLAPEISTFHSLCVRILRRHAHHLGYSESFTIYDRGDQESVARAVLRDIRVGHQKLRPSDLISMISSWKSEGLTPQQVQVTAESDAAVLGAAAYARYQASLRASSAMDFDDLLLLTEQLFEEHPEARFAEASRFDHLLIDEYQDTNAPQYRIVKTLAERHRNLCVVGDDDQSIYGWRGAEVRHILDFNTQWPDATIVRLEENYRSTEWILHLANTLIAHNRTRHEKRLLSARGRGLRPRFVRYEDETHEAESVVADIFGRINRTDEERVNASDIAILFRTNEQPRSFEQELRRAGVPYVLVGGQSFYDRKEIKDLISYLRVLSNPADEVSLLRVVNTPPRGIGTASIQTLLDEAVHSGKPLWHILPDAAEYSQVTTAASKGIDSFRQLIDEFRARLGKVPLSELTAELIARIDYKAEILRVYKDPGEHEARLNAVQEFVNAVAVYEKRNEAPSLNGFLEESALAGREEDKDEDKRKEHSVTLMTLHSAKGLEFPIVYMVGLEEGLLPHKRSVAEGMASRHIEEERRLAYVGVTRAQEELTLSLCKNRMKWGKLRPQIPSRFVLEMRGDTEKAQEFAEIAHEQIDRETAQAQQANQEKQKGKRKSSGSSSKSKKTKREASKANSSSSNSSSASKKRAPSSRTSPAPASSSTPFPSSPSRVSAEGASSLPSAPNADGAPNLDATEQPRESKSASAVQNRSASRRAPVRKESVAQPSETGSSSPTGQTQEKRAQFDQPVSGSERFEQVSLFGD